MVCPPGSALLLRETFRRLRGRRRVVVGGLERLYVAEADRRPRSYSSASVRSGAADIISSKADISSHPPHISRTAGDITGWSVHIIWRLVDMKGWAVHISSEPVDMRS